MSTADYTDGGGWAKLDQRSARRLSEILVSFNDARTRATWTRMLLALYASIGQSGRTSLGAKRLSKLSDTTEKQAERFLAAMESQGFIEPVGEIENGKYHHRKFQWMAVGPAEEGPYPPTEVGPSPPQTPIDAGPYPPANPPKSGTHQRVQSTQKGALCAPAGPGAAKTPPRPDQTATNPAIWTIPPAAKPPDESQAV